MFRLNVVSLIWFLDLHLYSPVPVVAFIKVRAALPSDSFTLSPSVRLTIFLHR